MVLKKFRFVRKHDVGGLLSELGIKTPLSKIQVLTDISFKEVKEK